MSDGQDERDKGMRKVLRREWQVWYQGWIEEHVQIGWEGTAAEIRARMERADGFVPPHHHNAWGANFMALVSKRKKWFADTGRSENNIARASHARRNPVWRRTLNGKTDGR
jgi:hypothetical protein